MSWSRSWKLCCVLMVLAVVLAGLLTVVLGAFTLGVPGTSGPSVPW